MEFYQQDKNWPLPIASANNLYFYRSKKETSDSDHWKVCLECICCASLSVYTTLYHTYYTCICFVFLDTSQLCVSCLMWEKRVEPDRGNSIFWSELLREEVVNLISNPCQTFCFNLAKIDVFNHNSGHISQWCGTNMIFPPLQSWFGWCMQLNIVPCR